MMDFGLYAAEVEVAERLRELRVAAARRALLGQARAGRPGLRARVGEALIRAGRRLAGPAAARPRTGGLARARLP